MDKPELTNEHLVKVGNKYYEINHEDGKPVLKEVDVKQVRKEEKLIGELAKKLVGNLDGEAVLREALRRLEFKEVEKLGKMLKSKRKYKPKTREGHCTDMKVGGFILPIN